MNTFVKILATTNSYESVCCPPLPNGHFTFSVSGIEQYNIADKKSPVSSNENRYPSPCPSSVPHAGVPPPYCMSQLKANDPRFSIITD